MIYDNVIGHRLTQSHTVLSSLTYWARVRSINIKQQLKNNEKPQRYAHTLQTSYKR